MAGAARSGITCAWKRAVALGASGETKIVIAPPDGRTARPPAVTIATIVGVPSLGYEFHHLSKSRCSSVSRHRIGVDYRPS